MNFTISYADENILFNHSSWQNAPSEDFKPHSHDIAELLLFIKGKATYTCGDREYRLRPYDLIISRPFEVHDITPSQDHFYERYDILVGETLQSHFLSADLDVINIGGNRELLHLFEKMEHYRNVLNEEDAKPLLHGIVREILVDITLEYGASKSENTHTQTNAIVRDAISYIDSNLLTLSGIDELCRELFITKSHLHHLFMEHMNTSPKKYVIAKRLSLARQEIYAGARPTAIYEKYGFSDYSAFYRAYRARFGKSPSDKGGDTPISMDENTYYTDEP